MNLTAYMQEKTWLLNFPWILFKIAISSAELKQAEKNSFLPKDLPHSSFKCQKACIVVFVFLFFFLSSLPEKNSKDCAIFNIRIIKDCKKKMLLPSFYMRGLCIFSWIRTSTKAKAICLHNIPTAIASVRVTAWGFSSFGCHVEEILCYLKDYLREFWEVELVTMTGCLI